MRTPARETLEEAADAARHGFGLDLDAIEPIPTWNSTVFRVQAGGAMYALRIHETERRGLDTVRAELAFLRHLRSHDLPVPLPAASVTGEDLFIATRADVPRGYDLTGWMSGVVRRDGLDTADADCLGATLGRIHLVFRVFGKMPEHPVAEHDELWLIAHASPDTLHPIAECFTSADRDVLEQALHKIQHTLTALDAADLETATIHKDFILGNCLWHNGELSVIDFADARLGPMLYDLAPMLTNIGEHPDLRRAFLAGYRSERPLSAGQHAALPALEAVRHISSCFNMIKSARQGQHGPALDVHLPYRVSEVKILLPSL